MCNVEWLYNLPIGAVGTSCICMCSQYEFPIAPAAVEANIKAVAQTVGLERDCIPPLFTHNEVFVTNHLFENKSYPYVEVSLDQATLYCMLNEDSVCNNSLLYIGMDSHLSYYLAYCKLFFTYSYIRKAWKVGNKHLELKVDEYGCYFSMYLLPANL